MPAAVRKAVFPVAGLGTRFLPATKTIPKEMLPIVDKPIIQYGVEEALSSGIENVIMVTGRGKSTIEDHFDVSYELANVLESRHKHEHLSIVRDVSSMVNVAYIRQKEALGLGHAVLRAKDLVGHEPFAVVLPDDVIHAETPCLRQLIEVQKRFGGSVIAVMEVPHERISSYGSIAVDESFKDGGDRVFRVTDLVEKPKPEDAPTDLAIIGRYVLEPEIFQSLESIGKGAGGEIQLTDGMKHMLRDRPIYAYRFEGTRYDAGDKLGFLQATVQFGLQHEELGSKFREYMKDLKF